ncbi:hypothetical protein [Brachybacterium halotolerans]|nr:hypothetical protein [Brachybacterium halotolerans]
MLPADIADPVRPYLDAEQDESRRQARLLLEKIDGEGGADA